jgi:hypothetical protein
MKRGLKIVAVLIAVALVSGLSTVLWFGLSEPPVHRLPLAPDLIDAASPQGKQLLTSASAKTDFDELLPYFVAQSRRGYSGVATGAIVVNAALHPQPTLTQATFFSPQVSAVRGAMAVTFGGLTLSQLAAMLHAQGLQVEVIYAAQGDVDSFRKSAAAALAEADEFLIVNYDRAALKQEGSGHISPIGAYNAQTDRLLVLDVAAQKYPFTWVPAQALWDAMQTLDPASGKTRGYLLVRANRSQPAPSNNAAQPSN